LAVKHGIDTGAGVIDADYRGQVKILLFNFSDTDFEIKEGDRIAQLIIERVGDRQALCYTRRDASNGILTKLASRSTPRRLLSSKSSPRPYEELVDSVAQAVLAR
jgi:deoxycytidine triphosphate deaminase